MMRSRSKKTVGDHIVEGLREFTEALEASEEISERFTVRTVKLNLEPSEYTPEMVRETRHLLGASQAVFAQFLGVSTKTVQSWEQGTNKVSGAAARLMDEIQNDPEFWRKRLREAATVV